MKSSFSVLPRPIHKKNKNHTCMWNGLAICTIFSHLLQDFSVVPLQTSCQHDKQSNANPTCKNQNSGHTDFWVPKFLVQQSTRHIWRNSNLANAQAQKNPIGLNTAYAEYHIQLHRKLLQRQHPEEMQFYMEWCKGNGVWCRLKWANELIVSEGPTQ